MCVDLFVLLLVLLQFLNIGNGLLISKRPINAALLWKIKEIISTIPHLTILVASALEMLNFSKSSKLNHLDSRAITHFAGNPDEINKKNLDKTQLYGTTIVIWV